MLLARRYAALLHAARACHYVADMLVAAAMLMHITRSYAICHAITLILCYAILV